MVETLAKEYKISQHCKTRYAERIMGKDDTLDISRYVLNNEEKIRTDIMKMIQYGNLIFTGKQSQKDGKGNVLDVYIKDTWVILVDNKAGIVVTLYKIDLGLDEEFNKTYIAKMLDKLKEAQETLEQVRVDTQEESNNYREWIIDAETQIREYKAMIKNLEELCTGYQAIIDNNCVKHTVAMRAAAEIVNTLVGKKEF